MTYQIAIIHRHDGAFEVEVYRDDELVKQCGPLWTRADAENYAAYLRRMRHNAVIVHVDERGMAVQS